MVNENREESGRNIFFRQNVKIFLSFQCFFWAGIGQYKNHIHTSTLHPNIFQNFPEDTRITCRVKNEAQITNGLSAPFQQVVVLNLVAA